VFFGIFQGEKLTHFFGEIFSVSLPSLVRKDCCLSVNLIKFIF